MTDLQKFVSQAFEELPNDKRARPWSFINHGIGLLETEDELNCYLAAYGKMHEEKIHSALSTLTNIDEIVNEKYQIIDWGCGQGLATICFLDHIKDITPHKKPQNIMLIEPSRPALAKAKKYINQTALGVATDLIEKQIDDVVVSDIQVKEQITIHFFSNILDIESIDLKKLAELIQSNIVGEQYFICVGPMNAKSTRLDTFAKLLNCKDEQLVEKRNGNLKTTRGTIKLLVFKIKGKEIEVLKSLYYPPMPNNNIMYILEKKLESINPNGLNSLDKIIEYYKLVIEIEQLKEPEIKQQEKELYSYETDENNCFVIDLESNQTFLGIFNQNRDPNVTRWPKDLNVSIEISIGNRKYSILSYTYLHEDIKGIDTSKKRIVLKLSDFELNYGVLTEFEKTEEQIDEIETLVKEQMTLDGVLNVFREKLYSELIFETKLSFALSSKNPALNQIYSELRKVNSRSVRESSLLFNFLFNQSIDNKLDSISERDLIQISNLDESQKKAVLTVFNNKVTVITGPPGSGKTQVIANILANAVMQNKRVLVASKNNKAVDNVKSRFDREESIGFFLRFGKRDIIEQITLQELNRIRGLMVDLMDNAHELEQCQERINEIINLKEENKNKLQQRDLFLSKLPELKSNINKIENELKKLIQSNAEFEIIRLNHSIDTVDEYLSLTKKKRNYFELKYSGLNKFLIDWFFKKKHAFELVTLVEDFHKDFRSIFTKIPNQITLFKDGAVIIDVYNKIVDTFDSFLAYCSECDSLKSELEVKINELEKFESYINSINLEESDILRIIKECDAEFVELSKDVLKKKIKNKLYNASQSQMDINNYRAYLPDNAPYRFEDMPAFENATKNFLSIFNIISVTSLSARQSLPLVSDLFDIIVIDEASQCDIASAIPLILRGKQLVVIGDPLQLKHITSLNRFEDEKIKEHLGLTGSVYLNYKEKSLWDYSESFLSIAKNNNLIVNLDRHYRCHPDIIEYSNQHFYAKSNLNLEICTNRNDFTLERSGIHWADVVGRQTSDIINVNEAEINKAIEIALYYANRYPDISIGIVTPFTHQADRLRSRIPLNLSLGPNPRIIANTAHGFQGDEKDVMIYSLVVTNNSPNSKIYWIDNIVPESVNVAVTRAKNTICIVGNKEYIRANSSIQKPLGKLLNYVENLKK